MSTVKKFLHFLRVLRKNDLKETLTKPKPKWDHSRYKYVYLLSLFENHAI